MINRGLDGSAIKYVQALSATDVVNFAGFSNPIDAREAQHGTLLVFSSIAGGTTACAMRSGTSNGDFQTFGASVTAAASGLVVRSFAMNSSAVFYRVGYRGPTSGSGTLAIGLALQGNRRVPVDQATGTTVHSSIA